MEPFKALLIERDETTKAQTVSVKHLAESDLMEGDVDVRISHSTINYKDGLAITGKLPVVRRWPMVPGVDFAGTVIASRNTDYTPGDAVLLNGWGVGELHLGAFSQVARVKADWLIPLPAGITPVDAMAVGTAGYTAMLAIIALEGHGLTAASGPAVVTGAAGGVGSIAVTLLANYGYEVHAVTGRTSEADYLYTLGAKEIIDRAELSDKPKMLGKERWASGIDAVGGVVLANLISSMQERGAIAAVGNAGGWDVPTSAAPFILRGVSLLGVESVRAPKPDRMQAWKRIAADLDRARLAAMTTIISFEDIQRVAREIVEGKVRGRVVVQID